MTVTIPLEPVEVGPAPEPGRKPRRQLSGRPAGRGPRSRRPTIQGRPDGPVALISSASTMVALVCLWVVLQALVLSGFSQDRQQGLLYDQLREDIAAATASIGPTTPPGEPVALLSIPRLRLSQVVVEGTASGDTLAGPGHLRKTVLPGQVGTSVVMGRAVTYGAPFGELDRLVVGDEIKVVMAQGEVSFDVVNVRRAGDPYSQPLTPGAARLTLQTAEGDGRLAALTPGEVLYVDADAAKGFVPPPGLPDAVPDAELVMERDTGAFPLLALHLAFLLAVTFGVVAARQRWSAALVWVVAAPVALALAWSSTDVVMRLLPNVL